MQLVLKWKKGMRQSFLLGIGNDSASIRIMGIRAILPFIILRRFAFYPLDPLCERMISMI
jgi:hypothetical protein